MPTTLPLTFWSTNWTLPNEGNVVTPLLLPQVAWIDADRAGIAGEFDRALRQDLIEKGMYSEALDYTPPETLEHERITVEFEAPAKSQLFPDLQLEFDVWFGELQRGGVLCFVPVLGIEAWGETRESARVRGIEAIRLEFARQKRLKSVHAVLSTQWCRSLDVERTQLDLRFFTLHELKEIEAGNGEKWLPRAAFRRESDSPRRVFEQEAVLDGIARVLRGRFARSVLLVGASGAGKTALVEELVRTAPALKLSSLEIWETTGARLIQQLTEDTGWQEALASACLELRDSGAALFVRSLADLFQVGQYEGNDVSIAEFLRPYLERGEILLITECTPEQKALIEAQAPGYLELFHQVRLEEPARERIERIASARMDAHALEGGTEIEPEAVRRCVGLQQRFAPYSGYPGKTIRFLESLAERASAAGSREAIDEASVLRAFCEEAGLPLELFDPTVPFPLAEVGNHFREQVFGQDAAIRIVVDLLAAVKAGMVRGRRPIASLLFIGPTGVGKTELAKVTAEFMFGDRSRMVRFDMSEYSELGAVLRLTGGACDGKEGLLTGRVRQEPFSLVLFDEVEKAHPAFFDLLLQILGDGRLTDARGHTADFCSTIVIMTSNLGAVDAFKGHVGFGSRDAPEADLARHFEEAVQEHLRPELFNRLDRVVSFAPLDRETTRRIVDREVSHLLARPGLAFREAEVVFDLIALDRLCDRGHDRAYGARQLQRQMREDLVIPLARGVNALAADVPFRAEASARGEELVVTVGAQVVGKRARRDTERREQRALTEEITWQRRLLQRLDESQGYAELLSRWKIRNRKRRELGRKFYENPTRAAEFAETERVIEACRGAFARVSELELARVRDAVEGVAPAEREGEARETLDATWGVITQLHDTLHPRLRHCVIGLYGDVEMVERLKAVYTSVARSVGHEVVQKRLYLLFERKPGDPPPEKESSSEEAEAEKVRGREYDAAALHADPPERAERPLGVELAVTGPSAHLFFAEEEGLHEWPGRNYTSKVVVSVMNCPAREIAKIRPLEIHRSAFFKRKARRVWAERGFEDREYHVTVDDPDHTGVLLRILRERFRKGVCEGLGLGDLR